MIVIHKWFNLIRCYSVSGCRCECWTTGWSLVTWPPDRARWKCRNEAILVVTRITCMVQSQQLQPIQVTDVSSFIPAGFPRSTLIDTWSMFMVIFMFVCLHVLTGFRKCSYCASDSFSRLLAQYACRGPVYSASPIFQFYYVFYCLCSRMLNK